MAVFRVGTDDAEFLAKQFEPVFTRNDLENLDNRNACIRMLANGSTVKPFNMKTITTEAGNEEIVEKLKQLSYLTHGRSRGEIEDEISKRYI